MKLIRPAMKARGAAFNAPALKVASTPIDDERPSSSRKTH